MAWSTPITPVSGTVITVAWAQSAVVDPVNWLRTMTGGADPPGSAYALISTSTTATSWLKIPEAAIDNGAITDAKMFNQKVNILPVSYPSFSFAVAGGSGFFDASAAADSPSGGGDWHLIQTRHRNWGVDYRLQFTANLTSGADLYFRRIDAGSPSAWWKMWHEGNDGAGSGLDADTLDGVQLAAINQVPSGLIAAFRTAAAIASGWTRFTDGDGRLLVGAGTTFSVTFTEDTAVGSSWSHDHTMQAHLHGVNTTTTGGSGGSVSTGGGATASPTGHTHTISVDTGTPAPGNTSSVAFTPVARVVVYAIKS